MEKIENENIINQLDLSSENIINKDVKKAKYKNSENLAKQWIDVENNRFISFMKTPVFNDFEYLHSIIEEGMEIGNYKINLKFWNKKITNNIETYISFKTLSILGGDYSIFGGVSILLCFFLLLIGIFLTYIQKIKIKQDYFTK